MTSKQCTLILKILDTPNNVAIRHSQKNSVFNMS